MSWTPDKEDKRYINLIWSMCTDALQNKGVDTKETFISNLRLMCKVWEEKVSCATCKHGNDLICTSGGKCTGHSAWEAKQ